MKKGGSSLLYTPLSLWNLYGDGLNKTIPTVQFGDFSFLTKYIIPRLQKRSMGFLLYQEGRDAELESQWAYKMPSARTKGEGPSTVHGGKVGSMGSRKSGLSTRGRSAGVPIGFF